MSTSYSEKECTVFCLSDTNGLILPEHSPFGGLWTPIGREGSRGSPTKYSLGGISGTAQGFSRARSDPEFNPLGCGT